VSAAAERYARAIFELGVETGQLSALGPEIERLARAYQESSELQGVLSDPLTTDQRREAMLGDLAARLGVSELANNALRVLGARRRLSALPEIAALLRRLSDEQSGILRASVVTAGEMPESFFERLKSELEAATGRKIVLEHSRDPSLIAGVVTRIGDNTIDGSIKGRLAEIERRLLTVS
jgi:F-type H+-transporting ATPase subunit delta